jgi:predicted HAD superfamily phosphohydrolase YqeG
MMRRGVKFAVADLDGLEAALDTAVGPVVVVFDVDNTLVPQGAAPTNFARTVAQALDRFEAVAGVERVIMLTNGAPRGARGIIADGNKPWTARRRLGLSGGEDIWVVGDQVLTDGVLARRLGGTFCHLVMTTVDEPRRQALMRWVGNAVAPLLFRPAQSR